MKTDAIDALIKIVESEAVYLNVRGEPLPITFEPVLAARAELTALRESGWQPIETCPKDGSEFLVGSRFPTGFQTWDIVIFERGKLSGPDGRVYYDGHWHWWQPLSECLPFPAAKDQGEKK